MTCITQSTGPRDSCILAFGPGTIEAANASSSAATSSSACILAFGPGTIEARRSGRSYDPHRDPASWPSGRAPLKHAGQLRVQGGGPPASWPSGRAPLKLVSARVAGLNVATCILAFGPGTIEA